MRTLLRRAPGLRLRLLALIPLFAPAQSVWAEEEFASGASFTKITEGPLVTELANWTSSAWGDYDNDGDLDAFFGAQIQSTRNYFYRNDGELGFTRLPDAAMPKIPSNQHGAAWADTDNDGHVDLIVTSGQPEVGSNMLYRNNGDGTFTWTDTGISRSPFVHGFHSATWGDYDNDGLVDLFIGAHDDYNHLYHNDGGGEFTELTDHVLINDPGFSEGRAWVDYDDDGDIDLHASNITAFIAGRVRRGNVVYRNDGGGAFVRVTLSGLSDSPQFTSGVCWADYDNDGRQDVFLTRNVQNALYHNDGGGVFSLIANSAPVLEALPATSFFATCAWGDYDNDGFVDLAVGAVDVTFSNPNLNHTLLYRNRGDGTFEKVTDGAVVTEPTGVGAMNWVDYDNDGFLDLSGTRGIFAPVLRTATLFHNDGNANAWLNVKLVGTVSNRSAIGAKVRVKAFFRDASRWQLREISGGDSTGGHQSLNAEFGLADATRIDTVRVEWPSGIVQELHDIEPRQFLTIREPLPVAIDIKPANGTNLIQPFSRLLIPVALLGSARLDVRDVELASLGFGPERAPSARAEGWPSTEDVNGDGFLDLVTAHRTSETGIAPGDPQACLTGELEDGTPFEGCDAIVTTTACGFGFELVFALLPLAGIRAARRRRRAARALP